MTDLTLVDILRMTIQDPEARQYLIDLHSSEKPKRKEALPYGC